MAEYGNQGEYGTGQVYGSPSVLTAAVLFDDIDTPARDLIQVVTFVEFVVDGQYLNTLNYTVTNINTGKELGVRQVNKPRHHVTTTKIQLVVDKHIAGQEYNITLSNLIQRDGTVLTPVTGSFFARDSKADSMLSSIPNHFNSDPKTSIMRHVLQALSESDDRIGGL